MKSNVDDQGLIVPQSLAKIIKKENEEAGNSYFLLHQ